MTAFYLSSLRFIKPSVQTSEVESVCVWTHTCVNIQQQVSNLCDVCLQRDTPEFKDFRNIFLVQSESSVY